MMLDEYKTPKQFWVEAGETACHATIRLYLHKLLGKTAYELLTGNKPQVGYFRVFGSKCYILYKHNVLNLLLNLMKVSYLVMAQTLKLTVSTIVSPERLKRR